MSIKSILQHWDGQLPVEPASIALAMGVRIVGRGSGRDSEYPFVGRLVQPEPHVCIEVNVSASWVHRRFVIAHCLAHMALARASSEQEGGVHGRPPGETLLSLSRDCGDIFEQEANERAMDILMPRELLLDMAKAGLSTPAHSLSAKFGVSLGVLGWQLIRLDLAGADEKGNLKLRPPKCVGQAFDLLLDAPG